MSSGTRVGCAGWKRPKEEFVAGPDIARKRPAFLVDTLSDLYVPAESATSAKQPVPILPRRVQLWRKKEATEQQRYGRHFDGVGTITQMPERREGGRVHGSQMTSRGFPVPLEVIICLQRSRDLDLL